MGGCGLDGRFIWVTLEGCPGFPVSHLRPSGREQVQPCLPGAQKQGPCPDTPHVGSVHRSVLIGLAWPVCPLRSACALACALALCPGPVLSATGPGGCQGHRAPVGRKRRREQAGHCCYQPLLCEAGILFSWAWGGGLGTPSDEPINFPRFRGWSWILP